MDIPVKNTDETLSQCLGYDGESTPYGTSYHAVLVLLANLWLGDDKSQEIEINNHTDALIGELCEHLGRLEITGMRLSRTGLSSQVIFATDSNCREVVLVKLTSSELISSITDLVMYILHMVQFRRSQLPSTPIVHKDKPQADVMAYNHPSQEKVVDTIGSRTATLQ